MDLGQLKDDIIMGDKGKRPFKFLCQELLSRSRADKIFTGDIMKRNEPMEDSEEEDEYSKELRKKKKPKKKPTDPVSAMRLYFITHFIVLLAFPEDIRLGPRQKAGNLPRGERFDQPN